MSSTPGNQPHSPDALNLRRAADNPNTELWGDRFFEEQDEAHCGKHALSNVFGRPQFLIEDMHTACQQVLTETPSEKASDHMKDNGWYSRSVLVRVLQNLDPNIFSMSVRRLASDSYEAVLNDPNIEGAIMNQRNHHWVAIVKHEEKLWYVDSRYGPQMLSENTYVQHLRKHPDTFAITREATSD